MKKPCRRLFMFRVLRTNECGLVRVYTIDDAVNAIMAYYQDKEAVSVVAVPRSFTLHVPSFWGYLD